MSFVKKKKEFIFIVLLGMFAFVWVVVLPLLGWFGIIPTSSIYYAAQTGNIRKVKQFLDKGINVNQPEDDDYRKTPLHMAAYSNEKMVSYLLSQGAEINSHDATMQTPLHIASGVGNCDVVKVLIEQGATVDAQTMYGGTPLYKAARRGHLDVVVLLLENGADVNLKNSGDQIPIFVSVWYNHPKITQVLLDNGASIDYKDGKGRTPLMVAKDKGFKEIEAILSQAEVGN